MSEQALRVKDFHDVDDSKICYFFIKDDGWYVHFPDAGLGSIRKHTIIEHEDSTISVSPSILLTGHDQSGETVHKHGYLTRGVWTEC